ncbi:hypothetical protein [Tichowtungia aerotolerans]|uniref:F5/8 type C domain-containing protein n=1 Tax=Tichowtungia aerotolerans TaxID=2697043 RepID=A0A6P1M0S0_9BACT|nr:hypothetical protein [Tichowtungia aerotolerans]QHI68389.1 hypothetical protein GT409_02595 [Tichowtungia aerotolerans]
MRLFLNLIVLLSLLAAGTAFSETLAGRIRVESRLSAYLNMDTAVLVFERDDVVEEISVTLSFREQNTQFVPAEPKTFTLSGPSHRTELSLDISDWPDGEFKVFISETGSVEAPLVRGIRKQTTLPPQAPSGPFSVGGDKMYFVDDWYFETTAGLQREIHPAELVPVEPWKSNPKLKHVRNSIQDFRVDSDGRFNVKIEAKTSSMKSGTNYWAQSTDLENWTIVDGPGARHSDCRLADLSANVSRLPDHPVYRRYDPEADGKVDLSQVRVRYSGFKKNQMWGDIPIPHRSRIAVWEKPGGEVLVLGDPITVDKGNFDDDEIGTWRDSNDNFGDVRFSPDGKTLSCYQARRIPRHDPFRAYYDNNLSDRILVTWSTTNGVDWNPSFFDAPTLEDPWGTQHYGVDIWYEEDRRLAFAYLKIYDVQHQKVYTEVLSSRDGISWNRMKNGKPFMDNGAPGTFNYGYSITTGNRTRMAWDGYYYEPAQCINVLHFMFLQVNRKDDRSFVTPEFFATRFGGRMVGEHGVENSPIMNWHSSWEEMCEVAKTQMFTPTFVRYRQDGWIGASPAKRRAQIVTKPLLSAGGLAVNAETKPDGFLMVEVLDSDGNEIEEYSGRNAAVFKGDDVNASLAWSNGIIRELPVGPFKLRITLEKAEVFALTF